MSDEFIPLSVPNLKGNELKYVTEAVETEWVSSAGPFINEFENRMSGYVKSEGAVAVQNGSSGLHLALKIMGVEPNAEVIVPTLTFIAAVNPVSYCGADPVFMDCDDNLGIDAEKLKHFLEQECEYTNGEVINTVSGKPVKAIVVVHVFGNMANMEDIIPLANRYNLPVIEDATEALGTYYSEGVYEGSFAGTIGSIGVYSFNGNKIMTTGGGGMVVSNDRKLLDQVRHLSTQAKSDPLYYTHDEVGYNYRMTNLQAALGLAQLEQLESFIETKRNNYMKYQQAFNDNSRFNLLEFRNNTRPNYWFYGLKLNEKEDKVNRYKLISYLGDNNIQVRPIWDLVHEQQPYKNNQSYQITNAYRYLNRVINIPCSSDLSSENVYTVAHYLKNY